LGLEEHRRRWREEDEALDPLAPLAGEIPDRLVGRHRMGDEGEVGQIDGDDERSDVVGESVEVVARGRLIGAAVAVEADAAEPLVGERRHLVVPHPAAAAEAIQEQDRRAGAELAPIELSAVVRCDEGHGRSS
jgi:hypothetical protein